MDGPAKTAEEIMGEVQKLCQIVGQSETTDAPIEKLSKQFAGAIAEHKKLAEYMNLLQSILGAIHCGLSIRDLDYTITYQNEVVTDIFGDRTGEKCYKAYEGKDEVCEGCPVELAYKDGQSHTSVRKVVSPDGETMYWENTANPIRDAEGNIASCLEICENITERKKAEEQLKKQQYYLEKAQEMGRIGTWDMNIQKNELVWTDECYRIFGLPLDTDLTYESFLNCVHPDDREYVDKKWKAAFLGKEPYDIEHRVVAEGKVKWVREKAKLEFDENGDCVRGVGFTQDITERKQAEELLRQNEGRFRLLYEESPIGYQSLDAEGCFIEVNRAWLSLLGYEEDEVIGRSFADFLASGFPELFMERFPCFKAAGEVHDVAFEMVKKDGSHIDVEIDGRVGYNPDGSFRQTHCVLRDITERKKNEELLLEETRMRNTILDNLPCIAMILKKGTREIVASNKAARQVGAVPGKTCFETVAQCDDNCPFCLAPEMWETGGTRRLEVEYKGTYYEGIWVPLTEDLYVHYIFDITARKQAEMELKRHQAELAHIWRVNTMGEMASGLAHELNQPLCAIANFANASKRIMKGQPDESGQVVDALEEIADQAERAGQIIRRLRTLVAKGEPRQSTVSINDVVEEVLEMEKAEAMDQNITIQKELGDDLPSVVVDPIQIEQVVLNIVRNAFDAMADTKPDMRRITIRTSAGQDGAVEVAIGDTGAGFVSDIGEKVFDPFFTTKTKGLGVGLSLSRSIIEAHGGKLWAETNQDGGATFKFTLPPKTKEGRDIWQ